MVKIYWNGVAFHPTGIAKMHREILKELAKKDVKFHIFDNYNSELDDGNELRDKAYYPIDVKDPKACTMMTYVPTTWPGDPKAVGRVYGLSIHEGDKLPDDWATVINNSIERLFVISKSNRNLFFNSGVRIPIHVIPGGIDTKKFTPEGKGFPTPTEFKDKCMFLNVNSWTGEEGDRKGTDVLIKAFMEEFSPEEDVVLYLKISTFWMPQYQAQNRIKQIGRSLNKNKIPFIFSDQSYLSEERLPELYRSADCFVAPTKGEGFGFTIGEAMACGVPVMVPKNPEAGYMDFVGDCPYWIKTTNKEQSDRRFFCEGNMMPGIDIADLRKQLRAVYDQWKKDKSILKKKGKECRKQIEPFTWEKCASKMMEVLENDFKE